MIPRMGSVYNSLFINATSINCDSGSAVVTPNIQPNLTYTYPDGNYPYPPPSGTSSWSQTSTGSESVTFSNCAISVDDIDGIAKSKTVAFIETTLNGTMSIKSINYTDTGTEIYSTNSFKRNETESYSQNVISTSFGVDTQTGISFNLNFNSSQNTVGVFDNTKGCWSSMSGSYKMSVTGTVNSSPVSVKYIINNNDYYIGEICTSVIYSGSPYSFTAGTAISTITPKLTGLITSCTSSPTLPAGLSIDSTTCAISGTPTTKQSATSYTITATNSTGKTTATISITASSCTQQTQQGGSMQGCVLSLSNVVTTPYGPAQGTTSSGDTDGTGNSARFNSAWTITTDGTSLYVGDVLNNKIRLIQ